MTDRNGKPLRFFLSAGQVSDYTGAAALLNSFQEADFLLADRGYDADWFRYTLRSKGITPCIPGRKSRDTPVKYDKRRYRRRSRIEMMFERLKDWRRVATRYDRCPKVFLNDIILAATVMFWLCVLTLDRLNTDARLITIGMINTGYRPSEGAGLLVEEIVLTDNVPYIIIQPNSNRSLKTAQSQRFIPLTGISLEAFREARNACPTYAKDSANLSATVNKFFVEHGLRETPDHTLYSLRHAMEDRMLRAGSDERVRMDNLGHRIKRERYGEGGGLAHVHGLLDKIAL